MPLWTGWGALVPLTIMVSQIVFFVPLMLLGYPASKAWIAILAAAAVSGPAILWLCARADRLPKGGGAGTFLFLKTRRWAFIVPPMMALMALGSVAPGGMAS
jgi:hypothetical protein